MEVDIRLARADDAAAIGAIYAPYCGDSSVSFEIVPPTADEMRERIAALAEQYPWIVCDRGGEVIAYAYAGPHHPRAAYLWSVTCSLYVHSAYQGKGIGRGMYRSLLELLRLQGFFNATSLVVVPHVASSGLHRALGFTRVGVYPHIGYKAGAWWSVEAWQKDLATLVVDPAQPLPIAVAQHLPDWPAAMRAGLGEMRE